MLMPETPNLVKIRPRRLKKLANDVIAMAKAVNLVYVNCQEEGISRLKAGRGFRYIFRDEVIKDKEVLKRIRSLVLPPAWEQVWICPIPNGHLQATGIDARKRKQYKYHPQWNACRNQTKFYRLLDLGRSLPAIRKQIEKDLSREGLPRDKVLAAVISLMEKTGIRPGNEFYEKLYGSFGLTTLKDKHVTINGHSIQFSFRGKKGVEHTVSLKSKKLARIVQHCRDIPGKELFQYIDDEGHRQSIDSGMVNEYLKQVSGTDFTAKDLRTWCGSVAALEALIEAGEYETEPEAKKKVLEVLDKVSGRLGNSRTVCRKYYVHPLLPEIFATGKLKKSIEKAIEKKNGEKGNGNGLRAEEFLLVSILEEESG
jgi:DNA topoisomerase I